MLKNSVILKVFAIIAVSIIAFLAIKHFRQPPILTREPQPQGTILFIPGYGGNTQSLEQLRESLDLDTPTQIISIGDGTGDLNAYAQEVQEKAQELVKAGEPLPDLIGFSEGGLIARLASTQSPDLFRKTITISSPHQGTSLANLGNLANQCPTACQQMRPDSPLLADMPEPKYPNDWLSIWTDTDEVIRPPESSELPEPVTNYLLQEYCPGDATHGNMPTDYRTIKTIVNFLSGTPLPTACPAR